MQRLEVEYEIQLADILEQAVECLDEDLDEVEQREGRLGGGGDEDEVEGGVVAVGDERGAVGVGGVGGGGAGGEEGREGQEVATGLRTGGDEGEDLGDETLLDGSVLEGWSSAGEEGCGGVEGGDGGTSWL